MAEQQRPPDLSGDPEVRRASLEHAEMLAIQVPLFAERCGCDPAEVERLRKEGTRIVQVIKTQFESKMAPWN